MLGDLISVGQGLRGLGCAASYNFPFDCDGTGYYFNPSCWVFDRQHWADVCALQTSYTGVPDPNACTLGLANMDGSCLIPAWLPLVAIAGVAYFYLSPSMARSGGGGRRRR